MFEKKQKLILALTLAFLVLNFTPLSAQEVGGNLGGSTGVFRPKSAPKTAPAAKRETKTAPRKATPAVKPRPAPVAAKAKPAPSSKTTIAETSSRNRKSAPKVLPGKEKPPVANPEELFEDAIEEGNAARDERQFQRAELAYKRTLRQKPRDARAAYGLGNIYSDQQLWDEAEKHYRQAIELQPKNADAYIALSYVLVQPNRGGNVATRFVDAEAAARRAVALDKNNHVAHDQLGVALEARGMINAETENAYQRAIELNPNFPVPYAHLARLLRKKGQQKDANKAYKKAIELANDAPSLILVAEILQTEQRYEESEKLLRRVLTVDSDNPAALFLLGRALLVRQNHAEAESFLLRSLAISPRTVFPHTILGSLYLRTERYEDAEKIFLKALPFASEVERKQLAGALGLVGDGYLLRKQQQNALRVYRKARELDADNPQLDAKIAAAQPINR
ncbi:MAG TPA: tetratricopeptide repeat protein [Pyrinomonadaceae bacterium]|nr:tetratricopeptide repeat protein [Pyrinomonadaceae bacterium]